MRKKWRVMFIKVLAIAPLVVTPSLKASPKGFRRPSFITPFYLKSTHLTSKRLNSMLQFVLFVPRLNIKKISYY